MGRLIDGEWKTDWYDTDSNGGHFKRSEAAFRSWVTADGTRGPSGEGGFKAESGRYHLYVSYACPWAHRALMFRVLKALEDHITVSVVHPLMLDDGWTFETDFPGATGDTLLGKDFLRQIYLEDKPGMTGRVTVPILWDKHRGTIVSNESAEIIRMFNSAFDDITGNVDDYWPEALREAIEPVNDRIYNTLNNGVYKAGFATSQKAYDEAVTALFDTMDWLEDRLSSHRYLMGERVTEADWRLVSTLFRFDPVYHGHFKCDRNRLIDFPNLWAYARELYQWPGIADTVHFDHIRHHYHRSHETVNPHRILPIGINLDWNEPHGRDSAKKLAARA
ncbi:glutathione S-transferase family protein [Algicella marina]|uniref:Glutathione S-transferase family protein n=1 Tax=Algicella marina TaxID=2683284 RepID=A0A6P1SWP5_9RHOB|nr:glutathione S-transferase family protein [Algicella marina]QHQ33763.1 glutathione S-transferase family protein [Algicella marina]